MADRRAGPAPWWNVAGFGFAALVVALVVIVASPTPTGDGEAPVTTQPVGCQQETAVCRLIELLEHADENPDLTPAEREAIADATSEVIGGSTTSVPATTTPPQRPSTPPPSTPPPTTSTTTTTTTQPPRTVDQLTNDILDDLLGSSSHAPPVTLPEVAGRDQ